MLRSILAVLAASVIAFVWGALSWGFLPWHQPLPFDDPDAVAAVIKANTKEHAMYAYPGWQDMSSDLTAYNEKWEKGPAIYAMVRPADSASQGRAPSLVVAFLINILASTALLLLIQKSGHANFLDRLSIAVLAGLFLGIISSLNPWLWLESPGLHTLATLADGIIPWTLAGAAIAAILPKKAAA